MISYNNISEAWFSDGFHTDDFETFENFVEWLHEQNLYLDDDTIPEYFYCLQKERAEHFMNEVNRK